MAAYLEKLPDWNSADDFFAFLTGTSSWSEATETVDAAAADGCDATVAAAADDADDPTTAFDATASSSAAAVTAVAAWTDAFLVSICF